MCFSFYNFYYGISTIGGGLSLIIIIDYKYE